METRILRWSCGVLTFQCGVQVNISETKLRYYFDVFKIVGIEEIIKNGQTTIPKGQAFQLKSKLT